MMTWLPVAMFGTLGVSLRFFLDQYFQKWNSNWPFITFGINITGSFLAGVIFGLSFVRQQPYSQMQTALLIGFCGGLTTFSSFSLQSFQMIQEGQWKLAVLYLTLSPVICLAATAGGVSLTKAFY